MTILNPLSGTVFSQTVGENSYVCRSKHKKLKVDGGVMCAERTAGISLADLCLLVISLTTFLKEVKDLSEGNPPGITFLTSAARM